jgi:anti-anti-sigma factor
VTVSPRPAGGNVVTVFGDLDIGSAPAFNEALERAAQVDADVELDMRGCSFVDSMGIAALIMAARRLHERGRLLRIRGARERIRNIFALAGLIDQHWIELVTNGDPAPG